MTLAQVLHSRKGLYRWAWILFWAGVLCPAPGFLFPGFWGNLSGLSVAGEIIVWSRALPEPLDLRHSLQLLVLVLALASNLVFVATRVIGEAEVSRSWRFLLLSSLAANASVPLAFPVFLRLPGFWLWLLAWGALSRALLEIPGTEHAASQTEEGRARAAVPTLVWIWLGFAVFWMGVTAVNRIAPLRDADPVAAAPDPAPLAGYFNDPANLFLPGDKERFDRLLLAFEKETSAQVAVAVYPRLPSGSVESFTVATAERSRLGHKGLDNGAVLFVFMAERIARLEVGYGLEEAIPDARALRILDQELSPRFARGEYVDGLDAGLAAILDAARSDAERARAPGRIAVAWHQLASAAKRARRELWPALRRTGAADRVGISFFASLLGVGVSSGLANAARFLGALLVGGWNLLRRRPFGPGIRQVDFSPIWDTLKLVVVFAIVVGGIQVIAGGGSFGGAGAMVHW